MERGGAPWPALRWSDDQPLDLGAVVARCEFPVLARLVDDIVNSLGATVIRREAVLKLHGLKTFKRLLLAPGRSIADGRSAVAAVAAAASASQLRQLGRDSVGGDDQLLAMSLGYPARVRLLPLRAADHVYPTAGDLIAEFPRPRAVVAHQRVVLPEKGYTIAAGDVLCVDGADKRCTSAGVVDYLQCRHQERTIGLPAACVGHFTVLADEREYSLRELADPDAGSAGNSIELPQRIRFLPLIEEPQANSCTDGALSPSYARSFAELAETEYVACALQRRQYVVCTADGEVGDDEWLYLIPIADPVAADDAATIDQSAYGNAQALSSRPPLAPVTRVRVHLPLFHDLASYNAVHGRFRANLSMKHVVDCAPVERASTFDAYRCSVRDGYDLVAPAVVPRRRCKGSPASAAGGSECFELTSGSDDTSDSRRSSSSRNGVADDEKLVRTATTSSTYDCDSAPPLFIGSSIGLSSRFGTDNAYVITPSGFSPDSRRRSSGAAAAAGNRLVASSSAASPALLRHQLASCSQPATPQASRQKKTKAKWTEKLAQSLSNLRLAGGGNSSNSGGTSAGRGRTGGSCPKAGRGSSTSPLQRRHLLTSGGGSDRTSTSSTESSDDDHETEMTGSAGSTSDLGCGRQPTRFDKDSLPPVDGVSRRGSGAQLPNALLTSAGGSSTSGALYENVSAVLLGIGFGRSSPQQQQQRQLSVQPPRASHEAPGIQLLQQSQQNQPVRGLWAPPSLPDYRDHTTGAPVSATAATAVPLAVNVPGSSGGLISDSFERSPSDAAPIRVRMSPSPSISSTSANGLAPPPLPPAPSRSPCVPPQYSCQLPMPVDHRALPGRSIIHQQNMATASGPVERLHTMSSPAHDECHLYTSLYFPEEQANTRAAALATASTQSHPGSDLAVPTMPWPCRSSGRTSPGSDRTSASLGALQTDVEASTVVPLLSSSLSPSASQDEAVAAAASTATSATTSCIVRSLADVPDDLSTLSVVGLCSCLRLYNMANVAEKFLQQQVDGQFFMAMPETMFRDRCFDLSEFEVLKLKRLQNGWRPKMM